LVDLLKTRDQARYGISEISERPFARCGTSNVVIAYLNVMYLARVVAQPSKHASVSAANERRLMTAQKHFQATSMWWHELTAKKRKGLRVPQDFEKFGI